MVIRRGDVTDIAWVFARLEMKCFITNQYFTAAASVLSQLSVLGSHKQIWGSVNQGALELSVLQFGRCNFWSDPCIFVCIF